MPCYEIDGLRPIVHPSAFVHPDAALIGHVHVGARCYVAPLASPRGDLGRIILKARPNAQAHSAMPALPHLDTVLAAAVSLRLAALPRRCRLRPPPPPRLRSAARAH